MHTQGIGLEGEEEGKKRERGEGKDNDDDDEGQSGQDEDDGGQGGQDDGGRSGQDEDEDEGVKVTKNESCEKRWRPEMKATRSKKPFYYMVFLTACLKNHYFRIFNSHSQKSLFPTWYFCPS